MNHVAAGDDSAAGAPAARTRKPSVEPRLIALEGIDGAGTTTQLELLAGALRGRGLLVHTTREPSDLPLGRLLRQALAGGAAAARQEPDRRPPAAGDTFCDEVIALLFAADRLDHLRREIEPALAAGAWVLTDRYALSSLAYQGALVGADWAAVLNARARPADLTLLLDLSPELAAARRAQRGGPAERFDPHSIQAAVAAEYRRLSAGRPDVAVLDAAAPVEAVTAACLRALAGLLP